LPQRSIDRGAKLTGGVAVGESLFASRVMRQRVELSTPLEVCITRLQIRWTRAPAASLLSASEFSVGKTSIAGPSRVSLFRRSISA
jgi:hypothetical protein